METAYFCDSVRKGIEAAGKLAARSGVSFISSEQLLLGIIDECLRCPAEGSAVLSVFRRLHINLFDLITDIENTLEKSSSEPVLKQKIPIDKRTEQILKLSFYEAKRRGEVFIRPEDVLLSYLKADGLFYNTILTPKYALTYQRMRNELDTLQQG